MLNYLKINHLYSYWEFIYKYFFGELSEQIYV